MKVALELRVLVGLLVAAQVITALAGIALLERLSPAIGRILEENVDSGASVERMALALALPASSPGRGEAFREALRSAEGNVTESEEQPALRAIRQDADRALAGDPSALARVAEQLAELGDVNREAMQRADLEAHALGDAARWALAFLALVGLALSTYGIARMRGQLLMPIAELSSVILAQHEGERHRRCAHLPRSELSDVLSALNDVLDREAAHREPSNGAETARLRAALLGLLDRDAAPAIVWDPHLENGTDGGGVLAASRAAIALLQHAPGDPLEPLRRSRSAMGEPLGPDPDAPRLVVLGR